MIIMSDRLITGDGKTVLTNQAVYIAEGKISEIGEPATLQAKYPQAEVKSYPGCTLLPGFIDMHVHIGYVWDSPATASYNDFMLAYYSAAYAQQAFAQGVTTMRDVSSKKNLCAAMQQAAQAGFINIPRIIHTDTALCFTGGHGWSHSVEVNGPWQVRSAIRDAIKRGADWLKLMASHRSDHPEYTQEELDAAVDECHRLGKKVAVHAGTQPSIQMCIDAGFDTIEHGTWLTVEQARTMQAKGLVWVPTIVAYSWTHRRIQQSLQEQGVTTGFSEHSSYFARATQTYRDNFQALYETGVKIVTGTDVVYAGREVTPVAAEMQYFAAYGMPMLEVIQAATKTGAEVLGLDNSIGEIAPGKQADLVILEGNPLQDPQALEAVKLVLYGGKTVYDKS
ncbi:MAG: amidohydrolase family protein [Symbiobacteriaceae bacterium]|nr:amidohydrolase family protein [Symbiobacteriaceae bacterium]